MAHGIVYRDPDVKFGHYKVLPITTGGFVLCDFRKPLGRASVGRFATLEDASSAAAAMAQNEEERESR